MADRTLVPNVIAFLHKASDMYGQVKAEQFSQRHFSELLDWSSNSPIEDMFWIAIHVMAESLSLDVNDPDTCRGITVTPQDKVGPYRVDFVLRLYRQQQLVGGPVAVELDGHDFHDQDKHQRSYEKRRDRDLQRWGLKVLHFTGSDLVADPFRVCHEVLQTLGAGVDETYNPADPLGRG